MSSFAEVETGVSTTAYLSAWYGGYGDIDSKHSDVQHPIRNREQRKQQSGLWSTSGATRGARSSFSSVEVPLLPPFSGEKGISQVIDSMVPRRAWTQEYFSGPRILSSAWEDIWLVRWRVRSNSEPTSTWMKSRSGPLYRILVHLHE